MAKAKSKNPVGRPKFEVTEEVLARTERAMAQGLTKEQCAGVLGISVSTFQLYQAEYSEFSEAIKKGEASGIEQVTNALFENATVDRNVPSIICSSVRLDKSVFNCCEFICTNPCQVEGYCTLLMNFCFCFIYPACAVFR